MNTHLGYAFAHWNTVTEIATFGAVNARLDPL